MGMFLRLIACEVAVRELGHVAAFSPHCIDSEFLPVGNHDNPRKGKVDLQSRIDSIPEGKYDAILVGYGICNMILSGLKARNTQLVIPRAHDCITFFLGSKERYQQTFTDNCGSYYFTAGWLEFPLRRARAQGRNDPSELASQISPISMGKSFAELVEKYGEENALYLMEVSQSWAQKYQKAILIGMPFDQKLDLKSKVSQICQQHGWMMHEMQGDLTLLQRFVDGDWDPKDFLIVQPGQEVAFTYDEKVITATNPG